jgi:hypothetical protein
MPDLYTAVQIVMMPRDTKPHGTKLSGDLSLRQEAFHAR